MAGPFDSDAPIFFKVVEVSQGRCRVVLGGASQVLGETMQLVGEK